MERRRRKGFTLAEVLITLTILGVVAAITVPSLIQRQTERETVTKVKKFYSTISEAYRLAVVENGRPSTWDLGTSASTSGAKEIYDKISPYLAISKYCGTNSGCFYKSQYKGLFIDGFINSDMDTNTWSVRAKLKDGSSVAFWTPGKTECLSGARCGTLHVDINGEKGPNRVGHDLFVFRFRDNDIFPASVYEPNWCKYKGTDKYNGQACAAWVVYKGNMDYLRRDILPDWHFHDPNTDVYH